jgi:hypothetical protein
MPTQIYHDGFARFTIQREVVKTNDGCHNCGQNYRSRLFRYGNEPDDWGRSRLSWHKGLFCGKECHDYYHGLR